MAWHLAGAYVTSCSCEATTHWVIDGTMSDANGSCSSVTAFWVQEGTYEELDLAGTAFALYNFFPPRISSGDWHVGLLVDERVEDDQGLAIEEILSGRVGGPFAPIAQLVGEYLGREYAEIAFSGGNDPKVWLHGRGGFHFVPTLDASGQPIAAPHAMFPFATDFVVGRTTGEHNAYGETWTPAYGEYARFRFDADTLGVEQGFAVRR